MKFDELVWDEINEEHIARRGITPEDVEEVVFDRASLVLRTRREGYLRYLVLGLSDARGHLFVVLEPLGDRRAYVVTARDMTDSEKRRFKGR